MSELDPHVVFGPDEYIAVIGAGYTGSNLYLPKFIELGVSPESIVVVDTVLERAEAANNNILGGRSPYTGTDASKAFEAMLADDRVPRAVVVASNTHSHLDNLAAVVDVAEMIDGRSVDVWSEKPVTAPDDFEAALRLVEGRHNVALSVGYILSFSDVLPEIPSGSVTSTDWLYGKDRRKDTRPTMGVVPDEVVHPLATGGYIAKAMGDGSYDIIVHDSEISYEPFANEEVQRAAGYPTRVSSGIQATVEYVTTHGSFMSQIDSRFTFDREVRQATIVLDAGEDLVLSFDQRKDGERWDVLRTASGNDIARSKADKARAQMVSFLDAMSGNAEARRSLTPLTEEMVIQRALSRMIELNQS